MAARRLIAPTLPEAMARIRAEYGAGAVVTGWRQVNGAIEIDLDVPGLSDGPSPNPAVSAERAEFDAWNSVVAAKPGKPRAPRHDVFGGLDQAAARPARTPTPKAAVPQKPAQASGTSALAKPALSTPRPGLSQRQLDLVRLGLPATSLKAWTSLVSDQDLKSALESALSARIRVARHDLVPTQPIALVGAPGSGKTVMAAKLAAQALSQGAQVTLIGTDTERTGATAQLQGLAHKLGARFHEAPILSLAARLVEQAVERGDVVLVDTPAASHLSSPDRRLVSRIAEDTGADMMVCLPADARADDLSDTANAWCAMGPCAAALTRLDLTTRVLGVLDACASADLPIAWLGTGPWIAGALEAPTAASLVGQCRLDELQTAAVSAKPASTRQIDRPARERMRS